MGAMLPVLLLLTTIILLVNSFTIVPRTNYGLVYRFGKATGRALDEGWHFILPLIDDVRCYPYKTQKRDVEVSVQSNEDDGTSLELLIKGHFEFYPDPAMILQYRKETEESITGGVINAVKEELGVIAGKTKAFDFIKSREAIVLIVNCMLRLQDLPHHYARQYGEQEDHIGPEGRLDFYRNHRTEIIYGTAVIHGLENEADFPNERSLIEKRYGIDIRVFTLADVDFSEAVKKAFESKREQEQKMKGVEVVANQKLKIAKKWQRHGLKPAEAANEADVTVGHGEKKIFSIEGADRILGQDS